MATLFRPVGLNELSLIWDLEFRGFPPRLPQQPFFYPVTSAEYAREIADQWNVNDEASGFSGFVTRFEMPDDYLLTMEQHVVGNKTHVEYWIPAAQLDGFNRAITGSIEVGEAFFGTRFVGYVPLKYGLSAKTAVEQFVVLAKTWDYSRMDFDFTIAGNCKAIYLNSWFWAQHDFARLGLDSVQKAKVMDLIRNSWIRVVTNRPLPPPLRENAREGEEHKNSPRAI